MNSANYILKSKSSSSPLASSSLPLSESPLSDSGSFSSDSPVESLLIFNASRISSSLIHGLVVRPLISACLNSQRHFHQQL